MLWWLPLVFLATAAVLWIDPWPYQKPDKEITILPSWVADPATSRQPTFTPQIQLAGFTFRCTECHNLFPSPPETLRPLTQHRHILRKHGINNRCFNCHHRSNRSALVDDKGAQIPYDQPQFLCAKCHGPVYRDWLHGVHGRTNGYWNADLGSKQHRQCLECHDPHIPAFASMIPAPGPEIPRGGSRMVMPDYHENLNPLNISKQDRSITGDRH